MIKTFVRRLLDKFLTIIEVRKGTRYAKNGDNIICGIIIGLNQCKSDIFEKTYMEVKN